jgi:sec-independent protein translocase protein TatA
MGTLSPIHWIVFLLIALLLFGPARLANIGKGLGEGIRNFKKGLDAENGEEGKDAAQLPAAGAASAASKETRRSGDSVT